MLKRLKVRALSFRLTLKEIFKDCQELSLISDLLTSRVFNSMYEIISLLMRSFSMEKLGICITKFDPVPFRSLSPVDSLLGPKVVNLIPQISFNRP